MRVLLAKLGKQAIACDETNRLNYGHFLERIIPCCLYSVNTARLEQREGSPNLPLGELI